MKQLKSIDATLRQVKEQAKHLHRTKGIKHKVALEILARSLGYPNYDFLQKLAQAEPCKRDLLMVVSDIPPPRPQLQSAYCPTPEEFHHQRAQLGNKQYAIKIYNEDTPSDWWRNLWYFTDSIQDAIALGMRWHERNYALEQHPIEQDGEIVYGYEIRHANNDNLIDYLYEIDLWNRIGEDMNAKATPEIMTKLRQALFEDMFVYPLIHDFFALDLASPDIEEYFSDWADELEG